MTARPPRLLGHPLHPITVHLPVGLLVAVSVWDALAWLRPAGPWEAMALWTLALGLACAGAAVVTGLVDVVEVVGDADRARVATWHVGLVSAALCGYGTSFALRWSGGAWAFAVGAAAVSLVLLAGGGFAGGHLVYRYGTGAHREQK